MVDTEHGLAGVLEYNTDLFDAATIARMAGHFQTLMEGIAADPDQRVSELPLLTDAEQHQLLVELLDSQEIVKKKAIPFPFDDMIPDYPLWD